MLKCAAQGHCGKRRWNLYLLCLSHTLSRSLAPSLCLSLALSRSLALSLCLLLALSVALSRALSLSLARSLALSLALSLSLSRALCRALSFALSRCLTRSLCLYLALYLSLSRSLALSLCLSLNAETRGAGTLRQKAMEPLYLLCLSVCLSLSLALSLTHTHSKAVEREQGRCGRRRSNTSSTLPRSHPEMCSGSEEGSYLRRIDFVYHSTLGLRVIKKRSEGSRPGTHLNEFGPLFVDSKLIRP